MKLSVDTLIVGGGYAGLICQMRLNQLGLTNNFIVEQGYTQQHTDKDFVVICTRKTPFTFDQPINVHRLWHSSGHKEFTEEYSSKVYHRIISTLGTYYRDEYSKEYRINNEAFKDAHIYGNIEITSIDIDAHVAYGRVVHLNKNAEFHYNKIISTIPIHKFQKLVQIDLFRKFGIFVKYFPVGVKITKTSQCAEDMTIEYFADANIPFYRKQTYKNTIYYEYCLNKRYDDFFNKILIPGKFTKEPHDKMEMFYEFFNTKDVAFAGRFATWDPDFLLDHICEPIDILSNNQLQWVFNNV